MKKYYLHNGTTQEGPFDLSDLSNKGLTANSPIWYEGLASWINAEQVDELKNLINNAGSPPPFTQATPPPIQIPQVEKTTYVYPPYVEHKNSGGKIALFIIGIIILLLIAVFIFQRVQQQDRFATEQQQSNSEQAAKNNIKNNISTYVNVTPTHYSYSELGGIYGLSVVVQNSSNYVLDNVHVRVDYIKADGGLWKSENLDFTVLGPRSSQTLKAPDSERGTSVQCFITSIKSNALGL